MCRSHSGRNEGIISDMKNSKHKLGQALAAAALAALFALACATPSLPGPAPVVAVQLSTGQTICVYDGATAASGQPCDAWAARFQDLRQVPERVQTLVKAINHIDGHLGG